MKQYQITIDDNMESILHKAADTARMTVPEFLQHAGLLYVINQGKAGTNQMLFADENVIKSTKHSPGKPKFSTEKKEACFRSFVHFLNDYLIHYQKEYLWNYHISPESYADWLEPGLYEGESGEDSNKLHTLCSQKLKTALMNDDEKLCFETVRIVMDWGGTFYNYRMRAAKGNGDTVFALYEKGNLLNLIRRSSEAIREHRIMDLEYFTAGWSIIWYLLDMDSMVILSPREACAYNRILQLFMKEYGLESVPDNIDLGQLVDKKNRRHIPNIRYVYTLKGKLQMLQQYIRIINAVKQLGDLQTTRQIDEKLFMLGE